MSEDNIKLKPCPFCGSEAKFIKQSTTIMSNDSNIEMWDIACGNWPCYLSDGADWHLTKKEVAKIWNRRI